MTDYEFNQLITTLDNNNSYNNLATTSVALTNGDVVWLLIATILAGIGSVLIYTLFVKTKADPKGKFAKWLKNFLDFKTMWIESIMKILYYAITIFVILFSFVYLGKFQAMGGMAFFMFLCNIILGPIIIRLAYEMTMMFIMIWRNTRDIAENTKKK